MINVASSTSIARPAAEVFAFVTDVRNGPKWHTDILEAALTDDRPIGAGSTFAVRFKPFMGLSEGTMTVSAYEPPRRAVFEGRMGKMVPTVTMTVEPEGAGSRVTRRLEMKPPGLLRVVAPVVVPMWRKQIAGHLANLKRVLETG
jgi:uncharacterized protein YndB with AHSA1/START domain